MAAVADLGHLAPRVVTKENTKVKNWAAHPAVIAVLVIVLTVLFLVCLYVLWRGPHRRLFPWMKEKAKDADVETPETGTPGTPGTGLYTAETMATTAIGSSHEKDKSGTTTMTVPANMTTTTLGTGASTLGPNASRSTDFGPPLCTVTAASSHSSVSSFGNAALSSGYPSGSSVGNGYAPASSPYGPGAYGHATVDARARGRQLRVPSGSSLSLSPSSRTSPLATSPPISPSGSSFGTQGGPPTASPAATRGRGSRRASLPDIGFAMYQKRYSLQARLADDIPSPLPPDLPMHYAHSTAPARHSLSAMYGNTSPRYANPTTPSPPPVSPTSLYSNSSTYSPMPVYAYPPLPRVGPEERNVGLNLYGAGLPQSSYTPMGQRHKHHSMPSIASASSSTSAICMAPATTSPPVSPTRPHQPGVSPGPALPVARSNTVSVSPPPLSSNSSEQSASTHTSLHTPSSSLSSAGSAHSSSSGHSHHRSNSNGTSPSAKRSNAMVLPTRSPLRLHPLAEAPEGSQDDHGVRVEVDLAKSPTQTRPPLGHRSVSSNDTGYGNNGTYPPLESARQARHVSSLPGTLLPPGAAPPQPPGAQGPRPVQGLHSHRYGVEAKGRHVSNPNPNNGNMHPGSYDRTRRFSAPSLGAEAGGFTNAPPVPQLPVYHGHNLHPPPPARVPHGPPPALRLHPRSPRHSALPLPRSPLSPSPHTPSHTYHTPQSGEPPSSPYSSHRPTSGSYFPSHTHSSPGNSGTLQAPQYLLPPRSPMHPSLPSPRSPLRATSAGSQYSPTEEWFDADSNAHGVPGVPAQEWDPRTAASAGVAGVAL